MTYVADTDALVEAFHELLGDACEHHVGKVFSWTNCQMMAEKMVSTGAVMPAEDFVDKMKDNEDVKKIVQEGMANAWDEGAEALLKWTGHQHLGIDPPGNPYE